MFLFKLRRVLLSGLNILKWTDFQNFDESGEFWVKMVKQFKKMHWSSTQNLLDVKSYQELKNRSVLLEGDRERC
jgi:hypothetical protein